MDNNLITYSLYDVHLRPGKGFIDAKMTKRDFLETIKEEEDVQTLILEDGKPIFYINSPIGAYRVEVVE